MYGSGSEPFDTGNGTSAITFSESDVTDKWYRLAIRISSGTAINNLVFKPMIRLASVTDATYAPYENICPISGTSSVTAVRTGKNLVDSSILQNATYNKYGWKNVLKNNTTYTYSVFGDNTYGYLLLAGHTDNATPQPNIRVSRSYLQAGNSDTFTTWSDIEDWEYLFLGGSAYGAGSKDVWFQIELGSTATDYEPYQGTSVTVNIGQTVYGCSLDVVSGVMTLTKAEHTFNGTETTWHKSSARPASFYIFWGQIPNALAGTNGRSFICSHAKYNSNFATYAFGECFSDSSCSLYIQNDTSMTVDGFKALLADYYNNGNPVQVCYELATPQTIQLSPNQIEMLMRNNTVWSDAGVVTLNYARIHQ